MIASELKTQTESQRQPFTPLHIQIWLHIWCIVLMGSVITMYLINEQLRSKFFVWRCICNKLLIGRKPVVVVAQQHLGISQFISPIYLVSRCTNVSRLLNLLFVPTNKWSSEHSFCEWFIERFNGSLFSNYSEFRRKDIYVWWITAGILFGDNSLLFI